MGPFTLTNLSCANTFVKNDSDLLDKEDTAKIKGILNGAVEKIGIKTNGRDCATLMVKVESLTMEGHHALHIKLAVGEDLPTYRKEEVGTFGLSYDSADFIESENPKSDVLESVQFLADEFVAHFKEDNE